MVCAPQPQMMGLKMEPTLGSGLDQPLPFKFLAVARTSRQEQLQEQLQAAPTWGSLALGAHLGHGRLSRSLQWMAPAQGQTLQW